VIWLAGGAAGGAACASDPAGEDGSGGGGATGSGSGGTVGGGSGGAPGGGSGGATGGGTGGRATTGTGGATGGGTGGRATTGTGGAPAGGCDQSTCRATAGVTVGCATRFMYGVNYAWRNFGGDFGGTGGRGVAANRANILTNMNDMRASGVDVIRWWVWPDINNQGVLVDAARTPTGIGPTVLADVAAALELAAQVGVHIQFTFFSFDNFKADRPAAQPTIFNIRPIAIDAAKRAALMERAVRPFARAVTASPNASRCVGWDVINEPEWAIQGSNGYGDMPYDPDVDVIPQPLTHAEMERFVADVIAAIRQESSLPITVGGAAAKWARAWSRVDVDFYTTHIYDWVHMNGWTYDRTPASLGFSGKPVVMGEFPLTGLMSGSITYSQLVSSWYANGYAGALGWSVTDRNFNWAGTKANVKAFADSKGCEIRY
jgi:hypothetical protein